jgi:ssDNA-binding Zn-finger/Zn-ribbon topoisomerase 1
VNSFNDFIKQHQARKRKAGHARKLREQDQQRPYDVTCGECGAHMILKISDRFLQKDGTPKKFWSCSRFPVCRGIHGAHPDGRPLGIPGDAATKEARIRAHDSFDNMTKRCNMTRNQAYRWLRRQLEMTKEECHIAKFDIPTCEKVVKLCRP